MSVDRRSMLKAALLAGAVSTIARGQSSSDQPDLSGKSILITGCSSGFGYVGALHYARLGARVIASMRNLPRPEGDALRAEARRGSLDLHVIGIDVRSDADVTAGVAEAERIAGGALDLLVNNAGIGMSGPVEVQDMEATMAMFDTNVFGPQRMARAALPAMRQARRGLIVNISSQLGRVIVPGSGQYSPTKFALEAMSEAMAYELAPTGVEVCIIQPGGYPTRVWQNRNVYTAALRERADAERLAAYPALTDAMGTETGGGRNADPADVPRAIAEILAMPAGRRPLRRAVHPGSKPQEPINRTCAETQQSWLGSTPYGPWVSAVHD